MYLGIIKLDKFISIEEFISNPETNKFLGYRSTDLYLPTECFITEPTMVMPKIARAFINLELYNRRGIVLTYEEVVREDTEKQIKFKGSYHETSVILFELWQDEGSDGHTHYKHKGYMFCNDSVLTGKKYPEELNDKYVDWYFAQKENN